VFPVWRMLTRARHSAQTPLWRKSRASRLSYDWQQARDSCPVSERREPVRLRGMALGSHDVPAVGALLRESGKRILAHKGEVRPRQARPAFGCMGIPSEVRLPALAMTWHITARESDAKSVTVRELGPDRLLVFGPLHDVSATREALGRWLMRQTREHPFPKLKSISRTTGISYTRVVVRRQRTRWASCSPHGTVSLNSKLLFLPPTVVDYVMIHELCHIREMNHLQRFWALVEHHVPDYKVHDSRLRDMWKLVPRWAAKVNV